MGYRLFALFSLASITLASSVPAIRSDYSSGSDYPHEPPTCTDGGQLHCCQATFSGSLAPVTMAADLLCYDLTPAVVNCIITNAPTDQPEGCVGEYACCQVNDLAPVIGLFCSKPPGGCRGSEGGDPPHCLDVVDDRFGHCSPDDVNKARHDLGMGSLPLMGGLTSGLIGGS